VRSHLLARWPDLTDTDIHACGGHPDRLAALISSRTGQDEAEVRRSLDELLLAAV